MEEELRDALFDSKARPLRVKNRFTKLVLNVSDFKPFDGPCLVYCTDDNGKQFRYELEEFVEVFVIQEEEEMKQDLKGYRKTQGFYVLNLQGNMPTMTHETVDLALTEASRLAVNNPGQEFIVVERLQTFKATQRVELESY